MTELYGDSSRAGEWAAVRLEVDGQRIRRADAPALERDIVGLTLLEAAAVGGHAVGIERSRQLVNECLQVSPATHPPCNAQNACSMIVDEIKRGCALISQGAPGFCAEYR